MILQFKKLKRVLKRFQKVEPQMFDNIGYLVFREAQETCPVDTGRLKASGAYNATPYGWNIEYKAPYAMEVHSGIRRKPKPNPYESNVRGHIRNGSYVRPHLRTQKKDVKPMFISGLGTWRNIDTTKPMKANGWLEKAYQKIKGELPFQIQGQFPDSIVRSTRNGY